MLETTLTGSSQQRINELINDVGKIINIIKQYHNEHNDKFSKKVINQNEYLQIEKIKKSMIQIWEYTRINSELKSTIWLFNTQKDDIIKNLIKSNRNIIDAIGLLATCQTYVDQSKQQIGQINFENEIELKQKQRFILHLDNLKENINNLLKRTRQFLQHQQLKKQIIKQINLKLLNLKSNSRQSKSTFSSSNKNDMKTLQKALTSTADFIQNIESKIQQSKQLDIEIQNKLNKLFSIQKQIFEKQNKLYQLEMKLVQIRTNIQDKSEKEKLETTLKEQRQKIDELQLILQSSNSQISKLQKQLSNYKNSHGNINSGLQKAKQQIAQLKGKLQIINNKNSIIQSFNKDDTINALHNEIKQNKQIIQNLTSQLQYLKKSICQRSLQANKIFKKQKQKLQQQIKQLTMQNQMFQKRYFKSRIKIDQLEQQLTKIKGNSNS